MSYSSIGTSHCKSNVEVGFVSSRTGCMCNLPIKENKQPIPGGDGGSSKDKLEIFLFVILNL